MKFDWKKFFIEIIKAIVSACAGGTAVYTMM